MHTLFRLAAMSLVLSLPVVFAATQTPSAEVKGDDAAVVRTIQTMYAAATADDLDMFHRVAAPDFHAFDGGKTFRGDELMSLIQAGHAKGMVWSWTVTEPEVHVTGDTAWIAYTNRGTVGDKTASKPVVWLESAMLRKDHGVWKIEFFHSTRAA